MSVKNVFKALYLIFFLQAVIYGCVSEDVTDKGAEGRTPRMSLENIHFSEVEKGDLRWEGWAKEAFVQEGGKGIIWKDVRIVFTQAPGRQPEESTWVVEGKTGSWDPEAKMIRSDEKITIKGPAMAAEGKDLVFDLSLQKAFIGKGVSASIEGLWLEQK